MHGAIWKLSALATVIGFGLLAVVLQQKGLGLGTGKAAVASDATPEVQADGENPSEKQGTDGASGTQQSDAGPGALDQKTASTENGTDPDEVRMQDPSEDDPAEFPGKKTKPRGKPSTTGGRVATSAFDEDELEAEAPVPPAPGKAVTTTSSPRGRRNSQPAASVEGGEVEVIDVSKQPAKRAATQSSSDEESDTDPLDRLKARPGQPRGRGNPAATLNDEEADVVAQAPNSHKPAVSAFEEEPEQIQEATPRTTPRTDTKPRGQPKRNPHAKLTSEGDEPLDTVAPTGGQIIDGGRPNSKVGVKNPASIEITENGPNDSANDSQPIQSRPSAQDAEESETTPAVPPVRNRPTFKDDEDRGENVPDVSKGTTNKRGFDPAAPQPIPKLDRQNSAIRVQPASDPNTGSAGRRRPSGFADEEDGNSEQPPATFPVGKQRPRIDADSDTQSTDPRGRGNQAEDTVNPGNSNGGGPVVGDPNTLESNPDAGQPVPRGRMNRTPTKTPPSFEEDQPGAAESGNTATDVIQPRSPVVPAPNPGQGSQGSARGRARVSIDKIAPPTAMLGQPLIYSIVIRNNGNAAAKQVVVEDDVPEGVTMQGSIPQAEMTGRKLKWKIGNLEVGEEKKISVKVVPTAEGPVGSAATVNFVHDSQSALREVPKESDGRVSLELQYPGRVNVGQVFEVKFRLINRTNTTLSKLTILNQLPTTLRHESRRQDLEYKVETLGPREVLDVTLALTAAQSGTSNSRAVVLTADETVLESKSFVVDVTAQPGFGN